MGRISSKVKDRYNAKAYDDIRLRVFKRSAPLELNKKWNIPVERDESVAFHRDVLVFLVSI